ncbi:MAG: hypothetical protein JSS39_13390 [Nitrospira sp.]|nr:hypothetical protein [Nitrospira sp.]
MHRLLLISDGAVSTGFARVTTAIFTQLQHEFEIHQLAIGYRGDPHDLPWKVYPALIGGDVFGVNRVRELLERIRPNIVFIMNDLPCLCGYAVPLASSGRNVNCVAYFPVDGGPVEPELVAPLLRCIDTFVTYTQWSGNEALNAIREARYLDADLPQREVLVIPHGIDTDSFFPLCPLS